MTYLICGWWFFLKAEEAADWLSFEYCSCASRFQLSVNFLDLKADISLCDVMPKDSFLILLLFSFEKWLCRCVFVFEVDNLNCFPL